MGLIRHVALRGDSDRAVRGFSERWHCRPEIRRLRAGRSITIPAGRAPCIHDAFPASHGASDMPGCGPHPEGTRVTADRGVRVCADAPADGLSMKPLTAMPSTTEVPDGPVRAGPQPGMSDAPC